MVWGIDNMGALPKVEQDMWRPGIGGSRHNSIGIGPQVPVSNGNEQVKGRCTTTRHVLDMTSSNKENNVTVHVQLSRSILNKIQKKTEPIKTSAECKCESRQNKTKVNKRPRPGHLQKPPLLSPLRFLVHVRKCDNKVYVRSFQCI